MSEHEPTEPEGWTRPGVNDEQLAREHVERQEWEAAQVHATLHLADLLDRLTTHVAVLGDDTGGDEDEPRWVPPSERYANYLGTPGSSGVAILDEECTLEPHTTTATRYLVSFWSKVDLDVWHRDQAFVESDDVNYVTTWANQKAADHNGFAQIDVVVEGPEPWLLRLAGMDDPEEGD